MTKYYSVILFLVISFLITDICAQCKKIVENHLLINAVLKNTFHLEDNNLEIFYDQTGGATTNGYASQDFEAMFDSFDCQAADDFPADYGAIINKVFVIGSYFSGGPAEGFNIYFYLDNAGIPGTQVYYAYDQPYTFDSTGLFTISLDTFAVLPPGHYWVSVQCRMDFSIGGQWYWHQVTGSYGYTAQWQNPGGAWLAGCTTWGSIQDCIDAVGTDMAFALSCVLVPVELISFSASANDGKVFLTWSTATETNNRGFEIQRNSNRNNWSEIGFIDGYGTTSEKHNYSFPDKDIKPGKYQYRLKQIDLSGEYNYSEIIEMNLEIPGAFELEQNYPNPFNPSTKISWQSPVGGWQTLKVYDILGTEVATLVNEYKPAGSYDLEFNASNLQSGVYFYRIQATPNGGQAGSLAQTKKMILLK